MSHRARDTLRSASCASLPHLRTARSRPVAGRRWRRAWPPHHALQALLEDQRRALGAIRAAKTSRLRRCERRLRGSGPARPGGGGRFEWRRPRGGAGVVLVLAIVLPGSDAGTPTVAQAARLASSAPEHPAPRPFPDRPRLLDLQDAEIVFPNYLSVGWRAVGSRDDHLEGRRAQTVFYERDGRRIGYTIVATVPLVAPLRARRSVRNGIELRSLRLGSNTVVAWRRGNQSCVLSAAGVSREALVRLAAGKRDGGHSY